MDVSVFIATSLDGFIARENGDIDWLESANAKVPAGEDCGYNDFMDSVDALIMGSHSFEKVLSFGFWPYGEKEVTVLSSRNIALPNNFEGKVTISSKSPEAICDEFSRKGAEQLYIDGGEVIRSFVRKGLITDITITVIPVLIGSGRPLFGEVERDITLIHQNTIAYDFGFVQSTYLVQQQLT